MRNKDLQQLFNILGNYKTPMYIELVEDLERFIIEKQTTKHPLGKIVVNDYNTGFSDGYKQATEEKRDEIRNTIYAMIGAIVMKVSKDKPAKEVLRDLLNEV